MPFLLLNSVMAVYMAGQISLSARMPSEDGTNVRHPQREMKTPT